jgi:hypothetical protein
MSMMHKMAAFVLDHANSVPGVNVWNVAISRSIVMVYNFTWRITEALNFKDCNSWRRDIRA